MEKELVKYFCQTSRAKRCCENSNNRGNPESNLPSSYQVEVKANLTKDIDLQCPNKRNHTDQSDRNRAELRGDTAFEAFAATQAACHEH